MNARGLTSFMSGNSLRPHIPGVFMRDARLSWFYLVVSQQKVSHSLLSLAAAEAGLTLHTAQRRVERYRSNGLAVRTTIIESRLSVPFERGKLCDCCQYQIIRKATVKSYTCTSLNLRGLPGRPRPTRHPAWSHDTHRNRLLNETQDSRQFCDISPFVPPLPTAVCWIAFRGTLSVFARCRRQYRLHNLVIVIERIFPFTFIIFGAPLNQCLVLSNR